MLDISARTLTRTHQAVGLQANQSFAHDRPRDREQSTKLGLRRQPRALFQLGSDDLLEDSLLPFVSLAVAVILFEGGLTLRFRELREGRRAVIGMIVIGAPLTWGLATFAGLTPLILEKSVQAQFLIPMAVSLAFGVMFATLVTLMLVPSGYLILDDLAKLPARLFGTAPAAEPDAGHPV